MAKASNYLLGIKLLMRTLLSLVYFVYFAKVNYQREVIEISRERSGSVVECLTRDRGVSPA